MTKKFNLIKTVPRDSQEQELTISQVWAFLLNSLFGNIFSSERKLLKTTSHHSFNNATYVHIMGRNAILVWLCLFHPAEK
jgi:hypothetical protein